MLYVAACKFMLVILCLARDLYRSETSQLAKALLQVNIISCSSFRRAAFDQSQRCAFGCDLRLRSVLTRNCRHSSASSAVTSTVAAMLLVYRGWSSHVCTSIEGIQLGSWNHARSFLPQAAPRQQSHFNLKWLDIVVSEGDSFQAAPS